MWGGQNIESEMPIFTLFINYFITKLSCDETKFANVLENKLLGLANLVYLSNLHTITVFKDPYYKKSNH